MVPLFSRRERKEWISLSKRVLISVISLLKGSPTCFYADYKDLSPFCDFFCSGDVDLHITPVHLSIYPAIIIFHIGYS